MIYLEKFTLPTEDEEAGHLRDSGKNQATCYTSRYPFGVFSRREVPELSFQDITVLCGGNGSGKTTILNLIAECVMAGRRSSFNQSSFFEDYVGLCGVELSREYTRRVQSSSRIITSDDVFESLLDLRAQNEAIARRREDLIGEYADARNDTGFQMRSMSDLDRLRKVVDAQRHSPSRYVRDRVMNDIPEKSNGESAFLYFTREIQENGLYLLDEPENSLSPMLQGELKAFLEDSARFYRCQFVISTHSPFLLAMKGAKIYNLDSIPVQPCRWTELEHVRVYWKFFQDHEEEFKDGAPPF